MALTLRIDLDKCKGCASCMMECPDLFDIDETSGQSFLLQPHPSDDRREDVARAAQSCPENAITLEEDCSQDSANPW